MNSITPLNFNKQKSGPQKNCFKHKNQICKKFINGMCDSGLKCDYAHGIDDLQIKNCKFFETCRCVVFRNGKYSNQGKNICKRLHIHESIKGYLERLGVDVDSKIKVVKKQTTIAPWIPANTTNKIYVSKPLEDVVSKILLQKGIRNFEIIPE